MFPYIIRMITAFHVTTLVKELSRASRGAKIVATEFYKKERTALFILKSKQRLALSFSYHPTKHSLYIIPPSKIPIETREKPWPIFGLDGAIIEKFEQVGFDRILKMTVQMKGKINYVLVEAIGPNGNIWLLNNKNEKTATLRKREFTPNEPYEVLEFDRVNPYEITEELLDERIDSVGDISVLNFLEKQLAGINHTLAKEIVRRANIEEPQVQRLTFEKKERLLETIGQVCDMFKQVDIGYLYNMPKGFEAYPFKLSSQSHQPEKFKSLSLALKEASERKHTEIEQVDEEKQVLDSVKKAVKKMQRRIGKLEKDIDDAAGFEQYKKLGELLQIHFTDIKKGMESITVPDMYTDDETDSVTIKLDPASGAQENIEFYFKKHRKGKEGLELLQRRMQISKDELESLEQMLGELTINFETAQKKYRSELQSLLPKEGVKQVQTERLPYREHILSSGVTIYIGRDGSDNDRTTFDFARPYELWFHTQQCPGSHVVMKFPNKKFEPSKQEIAETAAIAAYHSKARNDSLVPVIYTERKYVRKPRKAKPGLVTVEREKSVMVEPKAPE